MIDKFLFYLGSEYLGYVEFEINDEETALEDIPFWVTCKELVGTDKTISIYLNDENYSGVSIRKEHVQ